MLENILDFFEKFGALGLFIHSIIDAVIFPIPAFFLQVSLSMMNPSQAIWLATAGFIGCLLGTPFGYLIGKVLGEQVLYRMLKDEWIESGKRMFEKNGETAIMIGAFTPIPFKVFTILSGALNFSLWRLIGYAALGRATKFYVVGILFYLYGTAAESMVKDVSIYIMFAATPIVTVFLLIRRSIRRRKAKAAAALLPTHGGEQDAVRSGEAQGEVVAEQELEREYEQESELEQEHESEHESEQLGDTEGEHGSEPEQLGPAELETAATKADADEEPTAHELSSNPARSN